MGRHIKGGGYGPIAKASPLGRGDHPVAHQIVERSIKAAGCLVAQLLRIRSQRLWCRGRTRGRQLGLQGLILTVGPGQARTQQRPQQGKAVGS
jgi:hypothetical protein